VNPQLQRIEVQPFFDHNHEFPIEHTAVRQLLFQWLDHLREIAIQRFLIPALNQHFVTVAKNQNSKPIPLRLKNPVAGHGYFIHALGEHGQNRRIDGKFHACPFFLMAGRTGNPRQNPNLVPPAVDCP
jgi:hypothetical protein